MAGLVYDPTDPIGKLLFNVLAMVAEFGGDLIRAGTREGMKVARANGRLHGKQPKLTPRYDNFASELGGNFAGLHSRVGTGTRGQLKSGLSERARLGWTRDGSPGILGWSGG